MLEPDVRRCRTDRSSDRGHVIPVALWAARCI